MDRLVLSDAAWERTAPLITGRPDQKGSTGRDNRMFVVGLATCGALRRRLTTGGTHHGNGGGNLQERRTRQLRVGGDQGRVSRAWPSTSSQHGRRREFR